MIRLIKMEVYAQCFFLLFNISNAAETTNCVLNYLIFISTKMNSSAHPQSGSRQVDKLPVLIQASRKCSDLCLACHPQIYSHWGENLSHGYVKNTISTEIGHFFGAIPTIPESKWLKMSCLVRILSAECHVIVHTIKGMREMTWIWDAYIKFWLLWSKAQHRLWIISIGASPIWRYYKRFRHFALYWNSFEL